MYQKLSIIVPAYNEENTIEDILNSILDVELLNGISKEIIVVDDCSQDHTRQKVEGYICAKGEKDLFLLPTNTIRGKAQRSIQLLKKPEVN